MNGFAIRVDELILWEMKDMPWVLYFKLLNRSTHIFGRTWDMSFPQTVAVWAKPTGIIEVLISGKLMKHMAEQKRVETQLTVVEARC